MLKTTHRLFLITFLVIVGGWSTVLAFSAPVTPTAVSTFWPFAGPTTDIPIGRGSEEGSLSVSLLTILGPNQLTGYGDPFSPFNSPWNPGGLYNYQYRIYIPDDYEETAGTPIIRVELFDPDSMNSANNNTTIAHTQRYQNITGQPATVNRSCGSSTNNSSQQINSCVIPTCEWNEQTGSQYPHCLGNQSSQLGNTDTVNAFWYMRVDDNRSYGGVPSNYTVSLNTQTRYELYYYQQLPSGNVIHVPLATYLGLTGDASRDRTLNPGPGLSTSTDIQWVSPGAFNQGLYVPAECGSFNGGSDCAGDDEAELPTDYGSGRGFEVDLSQDTPNLAVDPHTGKRYLQLAITAWSGSSENNFSIWAGPPQSSAGLPTEANSRNVWLKNNPNGRPTYGVQVFATTHAVRDSMASEIVALPLAEIPASRAGRTIFVSAFDLDTGSKPPIQFYFNTIPTSEFLLTFGAGVDPEGRCFDEGNAYTSECNNKWTGTYAIPVPETFTGGQLWVSYGHGRFDTSTWWVAHNLGVLLMPFESELVVEEGHTTGVTATVALQAHYPTPSTTYSYYTVDNTATAGADYIPITGTLAVTTALQTLEIPIVSDTVYEGDETFFVAFVNTNTPELVEVIAQITILNDDALPTVSIAPAAQTEGPAGQNTPLEFQVELTSASVFTFSVPYTTHIGTADAQDFQATAGVLTIPPGVVSALLPISMVGDDVVETDEQFLLTYAAGQTTTGTIINDDQLELLNNSLEVAEGNTAQSVPLPLTFSTTAAYPITISYRTLPGTAIPNADYAPITGTVVLTPFNATQTMWLNHLGDVWNEADENYTLVLTYADGITTTTSLLTVTLLNDDPLPTLAVVEETTTVETNLTTTLTVTLSQPALDFVTVNYATQNGTAAAGEDYTAVSGTLTFTPSLTTQTITIPILNNAIAEGLESFTVHLTNPTQADISQGVGTVTILDDDGEPTLAITSVSVSEAAPTGTVTVLLSPPAAFPITVDYVTEEGTAAAGEDYTAASGTVTFEPGEVAQTITFVLLPDNLHELDEQFEMVLSNAVSATIGQDTGVITIEDDDPEPTALVDSITEAEGNSGRIMVFEVALSAVSSLDTTFDYATQDGTATAGEDYQAAAGQITIPAGTLTTTLPITIWGDVVVEPDEYFWLTVGDQLVTATLTNEDSFSIFAVDSVMSEGDTATQTVTLTVSLSAVSVQTVNVNFATQDGTATAGVDYEAMTGTVTFAPGETNQTIAITIFGDEEVEEDEIFHLVLSGTVNAFLADGTAVITIVNDDEVTPPAGYTLFLPVVVRP